MIVYGSISNFGGQFGFKSCSKDVCTIVDCFVMIEMWFWALFLVFVCVNMEDVCYSRSSEQASPR